MKNIYTNTIAADLLAVVPRIQAQHGAAFRTRTFVPVAAQSSGERWWDASFDGKTKLWRVRENRKVSNVLEDEDGQLDAGTALKKTTLLDGVCFFDALHACAEFEVSARKLGMQAIGDTKEQLRSSHYRAFADKEGIVFSRKSNLPVPVAGGQILLDGLFPDDADEISKRSIGNLGEASPSSQALTVTALAGMPDKKEKIPSSALQKFNNLAACRQRLSDTGAKLTRLRESFNGAVEHKFVALTKAGKEVGGAVMLTYSLSGATIASWMLFSAQLPFAATSLTANFLSFSGFLGGFIGIPLTMASGLRALRLRNEYGGESKKPRWGFETALERFYSDMAQYPDSRFKDEARQLGAEIEVSYYVLATRQAYRDADKKGGYWANRRLQKLSKKLSSTALSHGLSEAKIEALLDAVAQNLDSTRYEEEIQESMRGKAAELASVISGLKAAPANESSPLLLGSGERRGQQHGPA